MAFSFTLPELRTELRALGHDGLPDHLILNFLSQLDLPIPAPVEEPNSRSLLIPRSPSSSSSFASSSSAYNLETSSSCTDSSCHSHGALRQARAGWTEPECERKFQQFAGIENDEVVGFDWRRRHGRVRRAERVLSKTLPHIDDGKRRTSKEDRKGRIQQKWSLRTEKMVAAEDKEGKRNRQKRSLRGERNMMIERYWMSVSEEYVRCKDLNSNGKKCDDEGEAKSSYGSANTQETEKPVNAKSSRREGECGSLMQKEVEQPCADMKRGRFAQVNPYEDAKGGSLKQKQMEKPCAEMKRGSLVQKEMEKRCADMDRGSSKQKKIEKMCADMERGNSKQKKTEKACSDRKCGSLMQKKMEKPCPNMQEMMEEPCADMECGSLKQKKMEKPCVDMECGISKQKKPCASMERGSLVQMNMETSCADLNDGEKGDEHGDLAEKTVRFLDAMKHKNDSKPSVNLTDTSKRSVDMKVRKKEEEEEQQEAERGECREEEFHGCGEALGKSLGKKPWLLETSKKNRSVCERKKLEVKPARSPLRAVSCTSSAMPETVEEAPSSSSSSSSSSSPPLPPPRPSSSASSSSSSSSSAATAMAPMMPPANLGDEIDDECSGRNGSRAADQAMPSSTQAQRFHNPSDLRSSPSRREGANRSPDERLRHSFSESSLESAMARSGGVPEEVGSVGARCREEDHLLLGENALDHGPDPSARSSSSSSSSSMDPSSVCSKSSAGSSSYQRSSRFCGGGMSASVKVMPQRAPPDATPPLCSGERIIVQSGQKSRRRRGGKIDRVERFAEMQKLWRRDSFLVSNDRGGKRKGVPSFHHVFSVLHSESHVVRSR